MWATPIVVWRSGSCLPWGNPFGCPKSVSRTPKTTESCANQATRDHLLPHSVCHARSLVPALASLRTLSTTPSSTPSLLIGVPLSIREPEPCNAKVQRVTTTREAQSLWPLVAVLSTVNQVSWRIMPSTNDLPRRGFSGSKIEISARSTFYCPLSQSKMNLKSTGAQLNTATPVMLTILA